LGDEGREVLHELLQSSRRYGGRWRNQVRDRNLRRRRDLVLGGAEEDLVRIHGSKGRELDESSETRCESKDSLGCLGFLWISTKVLVALTFSLSLIMKTTRVYMVLVTLPRRFSVTQSGRLWEVERKMQVFQRVLF
jgi:hypothetical protein